MSRSSPCEQALLWEFDTTTKKTVGTPLYESSPSTLPAVGALNGAYNAITTTFPAPIDLNPTKCVYLIYLLPPFPCYISRHDLTQIHRFSPHL